MNPYVYDWVEGRPTRKPIAYATAAAGRGRLCRTDRSLDRQAPVIYFDGTLVGAEGKSRADWLVKQLAQDQSAIGGAQYRYNRFQERCQGHGQLFFSLERGTIRTREFSVHVHGPQSRALQNARTLQLHDAEYDRLFRTRARNGQRPERQALIDRMIEMLRRRPLLGAASAGFHSRATLGDHAANKDSQQ